MFPCVCVMVQNMVAGTHATANWLILGQMGGRDQEETAYTGRLPSAFALFGPWPVLDGADHTECGGISSIAALHDSPLR